LHFLCNLVAPEAQCPASTLHDNGWTQPTENASLVILCGIEIGDDSIIGIQKLSGACWADWTLATGRIGQLKAVGTIQAEYMAKDG
jgi:hypothetical protein